MEGFNKYEFLEDLKNLLIEGIKDGFINDSDSIETLISEEIERATIYYSDCFDIAKALNLCDFTDFELGIPMTINELACYGLDEYVRNEFDYNKIEILIEEKNNKL